MPPKKTPAQCKRQKEKEKKRRQKENQLAEAERALALSDGTRVNSSEMSKITARLQDIHRDMVKIKADGDCLFTALLQQLALHGTKDNHIERPPSDVVDLRGLIADYILVHANKYNSFFVPSEENEHETLSEHCKLIATTKAWGTELEIRAAAEIFGVRIAVVMENSTDIFNDKEQSGIVYQNDWVLVFVKTQLVTGCHFNGTTEDKKSHVKENNNITE